ncbi:chemotaxis protein CheW [Marinilabiliaceae bacterium ANBcel2]|nr:chemotaxis protein CheW [Marinilabiliaceae bacterium ANBcel2]
MNSYLTFKIGEETFGVNVTKIMEIREYQKPNPIPEALKFVSGVIEYQNEVIPLIDTGVKFGLQPVTIETGTCIIIMQLISDTLGKSYRIGVLADSVADVLEYDDNKMKSITDEYSPKYIQSTIKHDDSLIYILNADKVFNQKEIISILNSVKKGK